MIEIQLSVINHVSVLANKRNAIFGNYLQMATQNFKNRVVVTVMSTNRKDDRFHYLVKTSPGNINNEGKSTNFGIYLLE